MDHGPDSATGPFSRPSVLTNSFVSSFTLALDPVCEAKNGNQPSQVEIFDVSELGSSSPCPTTTANISCSERHALTRVFSTGPLSPGVVRASACIVLDGIGTQLGVPRWTIHYLGPTPLTLYDHGIQIWWTGSHARTDLHQVRGGIGEG